MNGIMVLVPYPAQGHVSPMQKLGWELVREGYEVVIVVPEFIKRQILIDEKDEIKWVGVADGLEIEQQRDIDFFVIERVMENMMPIELEMLIRNMGGSDEVRCLIVDLLSSWAIKVAHNSSIPCAAFWPAMFATYLFIASIPHLLQTRLISNTGLPEHEGKFWLQPELPVISTEELPWLVGTEAARKARFKFWKRALERSSGLKWLLVNSFPDESKVEEQQSQLMEVRNKYNCPRVLPIGPICNCKKELKSVSFWEQDLRCLKWLEKKKAKSVVYISFGSWVSPIEEEKLKNMAVALEASGRPFIWVLRSTWRHALPIGFLERVINKNQGMVVSWAPQYQILQHNSVACYITHCGWNSILEALQFKKKLLCYPVAGDQFVNCAYVVDVWGIGLKLNAIEPNYVEQGIVSVLNDKEMDTRLRKLNQRIIPSNPLILNTFLQDLNNLSSSTTT